MKTKLIHSGQELSQTGTEIRARKRQWERGHRETAYASAACASASVSLTNCKALGLLQLLGDLQQLSFGLK